MAVAQILGLLGAHGLMTEKTGQRLKTTIVTVMTQLLRFNNKLLGKLNSHFSRSSQVHYSFVSSG